MPIATNNGIARRYKKREKIEKIKRIPYYLNLNLMRRLLFILIYSLQFYYYIFH